MSILGNILGALVAPAASPVTVGGDDAVNDFTGTSKNDSVIFDATQNLGENFKAAGADRSLLDGGAGIDTLTLKLTESQYAAFQAEVKAKIGAIKAGGIDFGDIASIFKIATGQQVVKFNSIGVDLKGWECIKFDVVKDPATLVQSPPTNIPAGRPDGGGIPEGNNAAKDDIVGLNGHTTFTVNDLLANDPGGANKNGNFYFGDSVADQAHQAEYLAAHGITKISDADGGTYRIAIGANDINYFVQIGNNGAWSKAHVDVTAPVNHAPVITFAPNLETIVLGTETAVLDRVSETNAPLTSSGSLTVKDVDGDSHVSVEVIAVGGGGYGYNLANAANFLTVTPGSIDDAHESANNLTWHFNSGSETFDFLPQGTQVRLDYTLQVTDENGAIDTQIVSILITGTNDAAKLTADIVHLTEGDSAADISASGQLLVTDVDSPEAFKTQTDTDGKYGTFSIGADGKWTYTADGAHNEFAKDQRYTDTFDVFSADGTKTSVTIDIVGTDEKPVCVPRAGDLLFKESFEGLSNVSTWNGVGANGHVYGPPGWEPVNLGTHGWHNASNDTEVVWGGDHSGGGNQAPAYYGMESTDGNYWLDTQATSGPINISHTFNDPTGGKVLLSFDIGNEFYQTSASDTFQFKIDGQLVGKVFTTADLPNDNAMHHFEYVVDVGAAGQHTLELVDSGANNNIGFAIDNIQIHDWVPMHQGDAIKAWTFEDTAVTDSRGWQDVNAPNGWVNVSDYAEGHNLGTYAKTMEVANGTNGSLTGYGVGEHQWLDTAASPGNIWIQLSEDNRTTNIEHDSLLTFSIAKQQFGDGSGASNGDANSHTDPNAFVEILWNYEVVATVKASDLNDFNKFHEFSAVVHANGNMDTDQLMIRSGGTGTSSQGLAIDHIVLNELTECDTHHNGALAAEWTFENHTQSGGDNVGTPNGFWNLNQWAADHKGIGYGEDADTFGFSSDIQVHGEDGHRALDTAASPGNIFLQAIPEGRGGVLGQGATMPDLVAGKEYHAEVMIAKQHFTDPALIADGHEGTDPDAWVAFQFNNTTLNVHASDIHVDNEFVKFDVVFKGVEGEDGFSIMSHGTQDDPQGLLIDSIRVHDWIV